MTAYIATLPSDKQAEIKKALTEAVDVDSVKIGMQSRVCDLENTIEIKYI